MSTVRSGHVPVVMIVDVQRDVVARAWERDTVVDLLVRLVARARDRGVPVLWVQHHDADLPHGTPGWRWVEALVQAPGEAVIHKEHNSAFEAPELEAELARLGATEIVLAGAATNWCIRATAHAALDRGYDLTLVADAHTTSGLALDGGRRVSAADLIADLNSAMTCLSYPGRRNRALPLEAIDFGPPGANH